MSVRELPGRPISAGGTGNATAAGERDSDGGGHFHRHRGDLATRLRAAVPTDRLRELHERSGVRHCAVAVRQAILLVALGWVALRHENPLVWLPAAALQGCVILSFIILLHDVVHGSVFRRRRPGVERWLGRLYALPSAIAASQFTRWHLDHHRELGSADRDPKRAHLSPKRNSRLLKALYMTPALFAIYARAATRAAREYEPALRRAIHLERLFGVAVHAGFVALLWTQWGGAAVLRVWFVPLWCAFPVAFMVNRIGQHYWVDAGDPAKWGTRMDTGPIVNFLFLNSSLHLEHHYFPGVPLYRLPRLNRALRPFWDGIGHPARTYRQLLWGWFVKNREAHTDW